MYTIHKPVTDLTPGEYRAFYNANFGPHGYMQSQLEYYRKRLYLPAQTVAVWNGNPRRLLGWALLTPVRPDGEIAASSWAMKQSIYTAQFYVKQQYRGKGVGKMLMNEVHTLDPRPHVIPHDDKSESFFKKYRVMVMRADKNWREVFGNKPLAM